jgi:hypothetical protein
MSWEIGIPFDESLAALQHVGLLVAAVLALALTIVAIRRRRGHAKQNDQHQSFPGGSEQLDTNNDASGVLDDYDEDLNRACMTDADDLKLDDIPAFTSMSFPNERSERVETADTSPETGTANDVSSVLFRLLATKVRICELERAERSKSCILESTCQVLERLKGSLKDSTPELQEEIEEMRELIAGELSASRQSFESALELKEIIETQCDLLKHPGAVDSAESLSTKQSYIQTIDASLERRLKIAERRESEFALGKERIMVLRKQMLKIIDAQPDTAQLR